MQKNALLWLFVCWLEVFVIAILGTDNLLTSACDVVGPFLYACKSYILRFAMASSCNTVLRVW